MDEGLAMFKKTLKGDYLFRLVGLTSAKILQERAVAFESKSETRLSSAVRLVGVPKIVEDERRGWMSSFYKLRDLFSGLQKRGIACAYIVLLKPIERDSRKVTDLLKRAEHLQREVQCLPPSSEEEVKRVQEGCAYGFFQVDMLIFVWVDGAKRQVEQMMRVLDANVDNIISSLASVFPEMQATNLEEKAMLEAFRNF